MFIYLDTTQIGVSTLQFTPILIKYLICQKAHLLRKILSDKWVDPSTID